MLQDGDNLFYVWHGCKSRAHTVAGSFSAANKLAQRISSNEKPTVLEVPICLSSLVCLSVCLLSSVCVPVFKLDTFKLTVSVAEIL